MAAVRHFHISYAYFVPVEKMLFEKLLIWEPSLDDVLDLLLDQEGLEVDPIDRLEADTPLHKAVRFVNGLSKPDWEAGSSLVELLLDAGADPRSVNFIESWNLG